MKVGGILETALSVADPAASAAFYRRLFGFETLLGTDPAGRAQRGRAGRAAAVPQGGDPGARRRAGRGHPAPRGVGESHLAFSVTEEDLKAREARLVSEGVSVESVVTWPGGSRGVYFRDPDRHLMELISPGFWAVY